MSRPVRILALAIAILIGAIVGRLSTHMSGAAFSVPESLDTELWQVISPGLEAGILHPGRGSHQATDALVITDHLFFRADRLVPRLGGVAASAEIELSPDSGTLEVLLGQLPGGMTKVHPATHGTQISLSLQDGVLLLGTSAGPHALGPSQPERFELSASDGSARIKQIEIKDVQGSTLLRRDYSSGGLSARLLHLGTALGALAGLIVFGVMSGRAWLHGIVLGAALLLGPVAVLIVPAHAWLGWLERLYLVDSAPSDLARMSLLVSCLPLLLAGLGRLLQPMWHRSVGVLPWLRWAWLAGLVLTLGWHWEPSWWMCAAVAWAGLPAWLLRKDVQSHQTWLVLDLLTWLCILGLGWGSGLWVGTLWRIAVLLGGADLLADRCPKPAMTSLFLLVLSVLPATEAALQASPLNKTWDPTQLSEERPSERGWKDPVESWSGRCGSGESAHSVLVAGGSSAGGAYQYKDDPEASFVAQTHMQLCGQMGAGARLVTHNYGRGNRDSFTISRTIETMLDKTKADVVVLYVGVNDLLADHHPLSRKQRESQRAARSAALEGVAGLARRLRLVTALWLGTRSLPDADAPSVPDVPLADAIENFERIADATSARGATLVLMTEHMRAEQAARLNAYRQAQEALARSRQDTIFLDARPAFEGASDDEMLVDQNHLTRVGGVRLGQRVAATIGPMLWTQGSSR